MKNKLLISIIAGVILTSGWITVSESTVSDISSKIVRLHIIANSNSTDDQILKMKVRDSLLNSKVKFSDLEKIKEICNDVIIENGFDYDTVICFDKAYFPTKKYENIILPAGKYNAVRVKIGKAQGENWWCVMYPPLCFNGSIDGKIEEDQLEILKESMKNDNYEMIKQDKIEIKAGFKLVELWQKLKHKF